MGIQLEMGAVACVLPYLFIGNTPFGFKVHQTQRKPVTLIFPFKGRFSENTYFPNLKDNRGKSATALDFNHSAWGCLP